MTDEQIAEIMGWPRRYGWPPRELARCRKLVEAAREEATRPARTVREADPTNYYGPPEYDQAPA